MLIFDLIVLAGLWVWALRGHLVRSCATIIALLVATALYVAIAQLLPPSWSIWRLLVIMATVWVLHSNEPWFLALKPADRRFRAAYLEVLADARAVGARRLAGEIAPPEFLAALREIEQRLTTLIASDEAWDTLRHQAIAHFRWLREEYEALLPGADGPEPLKDADTRQAELSALYRRTMDQARTFWQR